MDHYDFNALLERVGINLRVSPGDLMQNPIYILFDNIISRIEDLEAKNILNEQE